MDLIVCLLIVPVPLFPLFCSLYYGIVSSLGVHPHWLAVTATFLSDSVNSFIIGRIQTKEIEKVQVLALFSVGNVASSINMCFHYRYEAAISAVSGFSMVSIRWLMTFVLVCHFTNQKRKWNNPIFANSSTRLASGSEMFQNSRSRTLRVFTIRALMMVMMMLPTIFFAFLRTLTHAEIALLGEVWNFYHWICIFLYLLVVLKKSRSM